MDKCKMALRTINSALLSLERDLAVNTEITREDILRRVRDMGNLASSTLNRQNEIEMIDISIGEKNRRKEKVV